MRSISLSRQATSLIAALITASACSDSPGTASTSAGSGSANNDATGANLGDSKSGDAGDAGTKADAKADAPGDAADASGSETGADTATGGCKNNDECKQDGLGACDQAVCDAASGQCKVEAKPDGAACPDADGCQTDSVCTAGKCVGKPKGCDDNNPCTDNKCDKATGCVSTPNTAYCDDGNPCTADDTCADGKCVGGANTCQTSETNCTDGKDDDGDGPIDCADNDCADKAECANVPAEKACADKVDDDKDGATDCADSDCAADAACTKPTSETACTDKADDDGDGLVDCADNDCAQHAACVQPIKESQCADQVDDDKDGATDCADSDCAKDAACPATAKESDCTNAKDDDSDGLVDCADNDCAAQLACAVTVTTEKNCTDKADDDKDGQTDCADSDCAASPACKVSAKETDCKNAKDDDGDKFVDCQDVDCAADPACKVSCDVCVESAKPLPAGCDPCVATVCKADGFCCTTAWDNICVSEVASICKKQCSAPKTEVACNDKVDNDQDGKIDCLDSDCAANAACAGKETACKNAVDDDKDGMTDCQDSDCKVDLACQASACVDDYALVCGGSETHNNGGSGSTKALSGYDCTDGKANGETGPEYTYAITAECDGPLTVTLVKQSNKAGFLDLFILDAAKGCASSACVGHSLMSGTQATKTIQAVKGKKYFAVIDGYQGYSADFSLKVGCGCAGGKETLCTDKVDNDQDGKADCLDSDCAADLACAPTVETSCTDKIDNDKDNKVDCADFDCIANLACASTSETSCTDKVDNDADKLVDCSDPDCANDAACQVAGVEVNCANKVDDDKDGKTDCADADCAKDTACVVATTETLCANKVDDDKDGKIDCADADCAKDLACAATKTETLCGDKLDNDGDKLVDCADPDCSGLGACVCKPDYPLGCGSTDQWSNTGVGSTKVVSTYVCADGTVSSETGAEYTYGYTASCDGELTVTVTKTSSSMGFLDLFILDAGKTCGSTACVGHALMGTTTATKVVPIKNGQKYNIVVDGYQNYSGNYSIKTTCKCGTVPTVEAKCSNVVDDDQDGKTDCADSDCAKDIACAATATELMCADKVDNDKDGKTDCADADCAKDPACTVPATETNCTNKLDDDKDGKTDCADADCAKDSACAAAEANCTDKVDNDKDGKTDCADSDCAGKTGCVCASDFTATCGGSDNYTNSGAGSTKAVSAYTCANGSIGNETGSEYTYDYTATCTGEVTATLTKSGAGTGYLDLFVLDGAKTCAGTSCLVSGLMQGSTAKVTFAAKVGQKYNIVVDGYNGFSSNYAIKFACACQPTTETKCGDKLDDDKDGKIDCADSDCAKDPLCAPPAALCKPDYALACGATDSWGNGNAGSTDLINAWSCADAAPGSLSNYGGPEYTYSYTATCTGTVKVTVKRSGFLASGYLDLFILDGSKPCAANACTAHALMIGDTVTKSFAVTKGAKYNIVVDGYANANEDYSLSVDCAQCK